MGAADEKLASPSEIERIAASYPVEAASTPAWERERYFTPVQQLAWRVRFDPTTAAEDNSALPEAAALGKLRAMHMASAYPHRETN